MSTASHSKSNLPTDSTQNKSFVDLPQDKSTPEERLRSGSVKGQNAKDQTDLPPMLLQYLDYKRTYADKIIFFQVGDFFEVFFEDAIKVSNLLHLTLTSRDKNNPNPVPMCGVPVHAVDGFIERLVSQGLSVAVVSQLNAGSAIRLPTLMKQENGPSKVVIQRKLTRIVTPGIRLLSPADEGGVEQVIASAVVESETEAAVAYSHVQSGLVYARDGLSIDEMLAEVAKLSAVEVLLPASWRGKKVDRRTSWWRRIEQVVGESAIKTRVAGDDSGTQGSSTSRATITGRPFSDIPGYSALGESARRAVRLLCHYLDETTIDSRLRIEEIKIPDDSSVISIDRTTRDNLELVENQRDRGAFGTLMSVLNRCVSLGGTRLLRRWILQPLRVVKSIEERLDAVSFLKEQAELRLRTREILRGISDLERIAARLELRNVSPRELAALRDSWQAVRKLRSLYEGGQLPELLTRTIGSLEIPEKEYALLESALSDSPAMVIGDGEVIRRGYNDELDRLRSIKSSGNSWIQEYESRERDATGIQSLKVKFNYVLGYFLEVTRTNAAKVPSSYQKRQSTANAERFTTDELRVREQEILGADGKAVELETSLYRDLCELLLPLTSDLRIFHRELACLDVLSSLAEAAENEGYVRPEVDDSGDLVIEGGQHPVLMQLLGGRCVANDVRLMSGENTGHPYFLIVTGPNMGGKSTYLRQAALIVIMAQLGSFVPARKASIGVVDKIFARLGASDNIAEGESTFMVEMREAAHIVASASNRSLVLIDEIGRGTATADGLAIAQALLEWLVQQTGCRTLFATHFHELTELASLYPQIANASVSSIERGDDVYFTHEIKDGPANKSYGIQVARLAGLPAPVLARAQELMPSQEKPGTTKNISKAKFQLPLFERSSEPADYQKLVALKKRIASLSIDETTPLQALSVLKELQEELP